MAIDWNLIRCVLNKHLYGEPIKNENLYCIVKSCVFCGKQVKVSDDYNFEKLEAVKSEIISAIKEDDFFNAKDHLDNLLKDFGYDIK